MGQGVGKRSRLAFPWTPAVGGDQTIDVTVTSGACGAAPSRVHQAVKVKVGLIDVPALPKIRGQASQGTGCPALELVPTSADAKDVRAGLLCLLNVQRAARGLPLLRSSARLRAAALRHSKNMFRRNFFDHQAPNGRTLVDRLRRLAYWPADVAGENPGLGSSTLATPVAMTLAWMDSDGHRENILDKRYDEIGIGVFGDATKVLYTTDFGAR